MDGGAEAPRAGPGRGAATVLALALLLATAVPLGADGEDRPAADPERDRPLGWIFDEVLVPRGEAVEAPRALILVLDATPAVVESDAGAELASALERNAEHLRSTRFGVRRTDGAEEVVLHEPGEVEAPAAAVRELLTVPTERVVNVYAQLRALAGRLCKEEGRREVLLLSLDNGDAEDDLEATVEALAQTGIAVSVATREAFLSDTFWLRRPRSAPSRDLRMGGSESAFVDVPWGWVFQPWSLPTETVPSGFAMFGLRRLATGTGGRVFLHAPAAGVGHSCGSGCVFCRGDHLPQGERYRANRLRPLAPPGSERAQALAIAAGDPCFRATLAAWKAAAKAGIVSSRPSVELAGRTLRAASRPLGRAEGLLDDLHFRRRAGDAERLARTCAKLASDLEQALERSGRDAGHPRYRAIAAYTRMMLLLTRVNLLYFKAWCLQIAPRQHAGHAARDEPPDLPVLPADTAPKRIACWAMPLCHGVRRFRELRLPGGEALDRELEALAIQAEAFLERYDHTPFGLAFRRAGLARFRLVPGAPGPLWVEPRPTGRRPERGRTTEAGGVGPTTGDGR